MIYIKFSDPSTTWLVKLEMFKTIVSSHSSHLSQFNVCRNNNNMTQMAQCSCSTFNIKQINICVLANILVSCLFRRSFWHVKRFSISVNKMQSLCLPQNEFDVTWLYFLSEIHWLIPLIPLILWFPGEFIFIQFQFFVHWFKLVVVGMVGH